VPVETVRPNALDAFTGPDAVHQGLVALVEPLPERTLAEPLPKFSVILDQVTDPHNVGAILRSAAAFGAQGVISTNRHAARETATLAKSASGALELVPMLTVRNLAEAIETLKAAGTFVVGLEGTGERDLPTALAAANPGAPLALVMGSEGKGLRQKTLATCSAVARLPLTSPQLASLNVSNAAVLALYIAQTHQAAEG
ncbi:MAG: RNA methyltransferase, partial [Devosiaceae bacterium]|nr:RNA methyltransferase [Devosiaceae bacterium MH13]